MIHLRSVMFRDSQAEVECVSRVDFFFFLLPSIDRSLLNDLFKIPLRVHLRDYGEEIAT